MAICILKTNGLNLDIIYNKKQITLMSLDILVFLMVNLVKFSFMN